MPVLLNVLLSLLGEGLATVGGSVTHLAQWREGRLTAVGEMGVLLMSHISLPAWPVRTSRIHLTRCALL